MSLIVNPLFIITFNIMSGWNKKQYYVYILATHMRGTLYIGVTGSLLNRVWQHKHNLNKGFTNKYGIHRLVYYEMYGSIHQAIEREKQLKHWKRMWKIELIEKVNPKWHDLYDDAPFL
ncbi:MAG TPA: GIY-YIG nuclease family protein [Balneolales bacterium]|nr:GIY-YIG nuclease family protein [Balneolales bacterium]